MRYIGCKVNLLDDINSFLKDNIPQLDNEAIFCDIFSGTSSVARYFKKDYKIISNDNLYFSYVLQKASVELNEIPKFDKIKKYLNINSFLDLQKYLENSSLNYLQETYNISDDDLFIYNNYCPVNNCERMYFKPKAGKRIDLIRIILNKWLKNNLIDENEFIYLLAMLIETVPYYSNISGVYGAYLKNWDKRTEKRFELREIDLTNNNQENLSFNKDAHNLIREIKGDILYLDPPYNSRQYPPNYHLLETIAAYDYPEIKGKTGMRDYSNQISKFCRKREVKVALNDLIENANFQYIIMSYSTDGLLSIEDIEEIFKKHGIPETYKMESIEYRKYKSKGKQKKNELHELLFFIEKKVPHSNNHKKPNKSKNKRYVQTTFDLETNTLKKPDFSTTNRIIEPKYYAKDFLKCPFNYIGGKHKILPQIFEIFPNDITTFVDLFGGGFNVGINVNADKIIYNDHLTPLVELFEYLQNNEAQEIINYIESTIQENNIKKDEKEGFLEFRELYNKSKIKHPLDLYILVSYSFNYQFRFNNNGDYNNPPGTNRSSFTKNMKSRLIKFIEQLHEKNIKFYKKDFLDVELENLDKSSVVYCDPPYLITTGSYNDGKRGFKNWTEKEEKQLLTLLDKLNEKNIKFVLSNVIEHDGKINYLLKDWIEKNDYTVYDINSDYSNSNYHKKKREKNKNREILVVNY